jgi:Amt family ammonium transporter
MAGGICYLAVEFKNIMKWDDSLDVWGVHGVGGVFGTIVLGLFASSLINPGTPDGLFYGGGPLLLFKGLAALLLVII